MRKPLKISIVISCYNDNNVEVAINSALKQTYSNREIIVVDDGSNEEIKLLLKKLEPKIDLLITQFNQGQSVARNKGIEKATGDIILSLDSDDYFEPQFCEKALEIFNDNQDVKIVTCRARRFNSEGDIDIFTPLGGTLKNFLFSNSALGSAMYRKSDWEICGGYEQNLPILGFEDWEFYIRLLKNGGYTHVIPEVLFHYQVRQNSTTDRIRDLKHKKFQEIILKHRDLYKENFEAMVKDLFIRIHREQKEKNKILSQLDFRLGKKILNPVRKIKKLLNF